MVKSWAPRPYQRLMYEFGLQHPRCALLAKMGMGKTSAVMSILDTLLLAGTIRKAIIFAPLRVARSTWPEEAAKWEQFNSLRVGFLEFTPEERAFLRAHAAAEKLESKPEKKAQAREARAAAETLRPAAQRARLSVVETLDIQTVHYDILPKVVEILVGVWPFDMGVADEATKIKSFRLLQGGKRAQALAQVAHEKTRRWINLTGTFAPNGLGDLWGPMWFIDQGRRLGRTYDAFESRWFGYQRAKDAVNAHKTRIKRIAFPHAQAEILGAIKDVALALQPKDWFPISQPIVTPVFVDLPPLVKKLYREMEREMSIHLKGYDIEAFASSGKVIKCLQLANGAVYTGSDEQIERDVSHWVEAHDEKLQALESIIEEMQGEPVLVAYHFKPDLARLKKRFPNGRHINKKVDEDDFKAGLIDVAFVHAQSIGHGVDGFQNVCRAIVFFALWWDLETHDQLIERIGPMRQMQAGLNREVLVYMILARGTVDETIAERLVSKRAVQDATFDSLSYKGEQLWM